MCNDELDYLGVERWAPIAGFEAYAISTLGRVRGRKGIMKLTPNHGGYLRVRLYADGHKPTFRVHRLVAEAFIPNPGELPEVHHEDHNVENNCIMNLQWVDRQTNIDYRYAR